MHYSSKQRPTLDNNVSLLSARSGLESSKLKGSGERMIRQLEEKFKTIFEKVKDILERKRDTDLENEHLRRMILEETKNQEKILQKCREEIDSLVQQNTELMKDNGGFEGSQKQNEVESELDLKNKQISNLSEQMKTIMEDLNSETSKCDTYEKQILFTENEIQLLKMKLAELTRITTDQENSLERTELNIQEIQNSVGDLMNKNAELEAYLRSINEDQEIQEDKYKTNLLNYRALLKKYNANVQKRQTEEKQLEKLKEELNSKIKRLDVVLINNHKLEKKIKKIEEIEDKINKITQETESLRSENEKYKKKIMLNVHSDYEKPIYEKSINRDLVQHAKKQQKLKISKLFADEDKLISHISQHTKNGVVPLKEEEYIRKKDAQNEENFRRILEIKELERLKSQIGQQDTYIKELARNIEERETLLEDQKKEVSSLNENMRKINQEIEQYETDRTLLEKRYEEKRKNVDDMYIKYEDALASLPDPLRTQLEEINDYDKMKIMESSVNFERSEKKGSRQDKELEELLSKSPQTLEIRKK